MPRKVFLSFLGISNYEAVSYYLETAPPETLTQPVKYVQTAILDALAASFSPDDQGFIFLTKEALSANWVTDTGLKKDLRNRNLPFPVLSVDVESKSEETAIWKTFQTVFDCLHDGDEVYFDITHSWRYLPMLGMTLLNYAKALKRIQVKAIYYGALEQLGAPFEVKQLPLDQRPVPILNLVSFSELQDWALAADDLVQDGNPTRLGLLTRQRLVPLLAEAKGEDQIANNLREIQTRIQQLTPLIQTNRGLEIWKFPYSKLHDALSRFSAEQSYIKPLNAIIDQIREKVAGFRPGGTLQWLESVDWCIRHNLIQQGVTQLQEGLLAWLCVYFESQAIAPVGFFNMTREDPRSLLSSALNFIVEPKPEENWGGAAGRQKKITRIVMDHPLAIALAQDYAELGAMRNDINHGGYTKTKTANKFYASLKKHYQNISVVLHNHQLEQPSSPNGLINLSNHPSINWPESQRLTAQKQFGKIEDLSFPNIPPNHSPEDIAALAEQYCSQVRAHRPSAVHLMGEMTFTFALVNLLKNAGIPCVASTTERIVTEEDGKKIVQFQFIQFREY